MAVEDFDPTRAQEIIDQAMQIARRHDHEYVTLEHLLAAVIQDKRVIEVMTELGVNMSDLSADLLNHFNAGVLGKAHGAEPRQTVSLGRVVQRTVSQVLFSGRHDFRATDILIAILNESGDDSNFACYFLAKQNLDVFDVKSAVAHDDLLDDDDAVIETRKLDEGGTADEDKGPKKSKNERLLDKFCVNLNEQALEGKIDPLIGREAEVASLILTTARRTKNNAVIVGEPGVGKTAVVEGLAKMIAEGNVPDALKGGIVYSLEIGALMAGTKFRGDMEERVKQILDAIEKVGEEKDVPVILFIDEIHTMMGAGAGSNGALDVANLLKPALAKGKLRCIGGTTYEEYRKHFEKDRALLRRFQKLDILEPSIEDAKRILAGLSNVYAEYHGISYDEEALNAAVELTARYVTDKMLPDKAIDVIDAAGARQRIAPEGERKSVITLDLIEEEVSRVAKIPAQSVKEDETAKLAHLKEDLLNAVFGQDKAVETLDDAVILSRAGLRDPNKPQGSYLFAGPTGVGKTELAKQLAATLNIPLHRFDMSEYMEKHSVSKFIGSPPGYVGFGDGASGSGLLTNAVENSPHCVLLIDELEKAHPDIFNIFLQVMDNGQLTNSAGKTVNFRNVILIMTSNAGASELAKNTLGFGDNSVAGNDDKVIEKMFAPEFRNRLDAIVKFNALKSENMIRIVKKFIAQLNKMANSKGVTIALGDDAFEYLARKGYDPKMGARPLARLIQNELSQPLSRAMLFSDLKRGGMVLVSVADDALVLDIQATPLPEAEVLELTEIA
jgi:ATP-dependent Clp protease ATP-binding subunit ClpA